MTALTMLTSAGTITCSYDAADQLQTSVDPLRNDRAFALPRLDEPAANRHNAGIKRVFQALTGAGESWLNR